MTTGIAKLIKANNFSFELILPSKIFTPKFQKMTTEKKSYIPFLRTSDTFYHSSTQLARVGSMKCLKHYVWFLYKDRIQ